MTARLRSRQMLFGGGDSDTLTGPALPVPAGVGSSESGLRVAHWQVQAASGTGSWESGGVASGRPTAKLFYSHADERNPVQVVRNLKPLKSESSEEERY
jgi:hypothetical protein